MSNKNPTVGTLRCIECEGTVTVRLMKEGKGRAYYRCNAATDPGQCGTWVTFGAAKTAALVAAAAADPQPTPKEPDNDPAPGPDPSDETDDGHFLYDW